MYKFCKNCKQKFNKDVHTSRKHFLALTKFCSKSCGRRGRSLTEEHKKNLSLAMRGGNKTSFFKGVTPWNKGRICEQLRGKNHPNWKGGLSDERRIMMDRTEYKLWRKAVFERDDYTCSFCLIRGGTLNADHIKPWSLYPELRYAIDNGRTLCLDCHRQTETWGYRAVQRVGGAGN